MLSLLSLLLPGSCALKVNVVDAGVASVAKLRPTDNKDAFFTAAPRYYGVFDGVSQCPESRQYARALAMETSAALKSGGAAADSWAAQAQGALQQAAQAADRFSGSSTAVLMRFDLDQPQPQVCTYALGDSSALVLRKQADGSFAIGDTSGVMYHDNGAPYQLGGAEWKSDTVADGLVEAFDVGTGDYVLCFSDGVSGNVALNDIARLVGTCDGQSAESVAKAVVAAARDAKIIADDITAVAVRLGEGEWVGGATDADPASSSGIVETEVQASLEKPLGLMLDEVGLGGRGAEVGSIVDGSNAAQSGQVQEGDLLLRVGETDVSALGLDGVMEVLAAAPSPVGLTFLRSEYADADESWLRPATPPAAPPAAAPPPAVASEAKASSASGDPATAAADAVKGVLGGLFGRK